MDKFFAAVRNMFSVPDLRKRLLFTLGLLAVYRLGAHITAPGIDRDQLARVWQEVGSTLLGVLDLFSGGNFQTISIFALGVTPYITATIITQLMTTVFPQLKRLQEEGEAGRQKLNQYNRYLMVTLTTGTIFVMWLGEQITERGIGNGVSLLIFAGIIIGLPSGVMQVLGKV